MNAFNKHPMENRKNLTLLNEIEARLASTKRAFKNYHRAKRNNSKNERELNRAIENFYHSLIKKVQELYSTLPNKEDRVIVMLDRTNDIGAGISDIHCFLTPHFFCHLECDVYLKFKVEYQFFQCPFQQEIEELVKKIGLASYSTVITSQPNYPAFFRRVLAVQPERFIFLL